ncbi:BRISC and BRCA1-A complex member 1 [Lingula anatina]|uniref:BRISC and BRCA1-A complex member 1 n=1 Tax=Lingula anatina TaxID=7574 RepID=A0A1S3IKZ1_LINAN|nr:BRISC and BRCA1-A complex member 1 [Lingula anatina]|eukprot:XP_013398556.1 BRISC and BRCA1-A complex member 1 [Lingula anatina]
MFLEMAEQSTIQSETLKEKGDLYSKSTEVDRNLLEYDIVDATEDKSNESNEKSKDPTNVHHTQLEQMTLSNSQDKESQNEEEKERESPVIEEKVVDIICPRVNCPEKIIICLDLSSEMDKATFKSRSGDKFAPLKLVKRALGIFCHTKSRIDKRHEYALVVLQETPMWVCDFTNNPKEIISILEDVICSTFETETFDLSCLFDLIAEKISLPKVQEPRIIPPPYSIRMLFLYGRSHCEITAGNKENQRLLQSSPHFFLDAFYIHLPPSDDNQCQEIFNTICDWDEQGLYYVFEASKNPTKLYDGFAQLLAHPLQRPLQKDCAYKLKPSMQ